MLNLPKQLHCLVEKAPDEAEELLRLRGRQMSRTETKVLNTLLRASTMLGHADLRFVARCLTA